MITAKGRASEPPDMLLPAKTGGAAAVRRTLASTFCRIIDPMLVARPKQLRDASSVMRFRPAHQSMINRRHDGRASCLVRQGLQRLLAMEPRIDAPDTGKDGMRVLRSKQMIYRDQLDATLVAALRRVKLNHLIG